VLHFIFYKSTAGYIYPSQKRRTL